MARRGRWPSRRTCPLTKSSTKRHRRAARAGGAATGATRGRRAAVLGGPVRRPTSPPCRTAGRAAELTARPTAADVAPDGFEILPAHSDRSAPPLRFTAFGSDTSGGYLASAVSAEARFPDGTVVDVTVINQTTARDDGSLHVQPSTRDSVPFTEQQLVDLVKEPGFSYLP